MLIINNISIHYKTKQEIKQVIKDLSFQLQTGEALAILGPSGCGKSTFISALSGTIPLNNGSIDFINNGQLQTLNPKTHNIGLIPQNLGLLPWKTVQENCLLVLKIRKQPMTEALKEEIEKIYLSLNITDILDKYPRQLSGGQMQRAAIARALIRKPDLLLMDEPFSALDAIKREEARELFLQVWKKHKPTTILVTHSIEEALYLGSKIYVMNAELGEIKYQMNNPYFGVLNPKNVEYLVTKQILREHLIT